MAALRPVRDQLPPIVRSRLALLGAEGDLWLAELESLTRNIANEWGLTPGEALQGGSEALVIAARTTAGEDVILKIGVPGSPVGDQSVRVLAAAGGRGYARLLAFDPARRAMLIERLGRRLGDLGYSIDEEIRIMCGVLQEAWQPPPVEGGFMNGAEKAEGLSVYIDDLWRELDQPCPPRTVELAQTYAARRSAAYAPADAVLAHGDAHDYNLLEVPGSDPPAFKFIDPEGLVIERAYDLGVAMRGWGPSLLAGDAYALGRERASLMAALTGVDVEAIWEWSFIERVSTGLLLAKLGATEESQEYLAVAGLWAAGVDSAG